MSGHKSVWLVTVMGGGGYMADYLCGRRTTVEVGAHCLIAIEDIRSPVYGPTPEQGPAPVVATRRETLIEFLGVPLQFQVVPEPPWWDAPERKAGDSYGPWTVYEPRKEAGDVD